MDRQTKAAIRKRIDPTGKKKYVKQVTGRHNDTELHLAAQRRDVGAVREILEEIDAQMLKTLSGAEFDAEVAAIREAMVNEVNELGETALFTAAERGYIDVVKELLPYSTKEGITTKNRSGFDPLHIAASQGHQARQLANRMQLLLYLQPQKDIHQLSMNCFPSQISRSNGKNALHLSARQGHVDIVKALLEKDPQLARRTDEKGQTALHMTVKGVSSEVVKLLLQADPAIVMLPDKFGNTALHIATRKKRSEVSVVALLSASCFPWLWKQWRI
uniref:Ankyrin repeat-containing protein At3g12360-like n=1 Tax=Nicotiana sylvestris TaxID=4096 RepID=A0A1U7YXE7_NICSY|nr:PREDICTED: ankyrin repeat-containing protein At3g12360-like [Nicotiana sylvestris]